MKRLLLFLISFLLPCLPAFPPLEAGVPALTDVSALNKSGDRERAYRSRTFRAYLPLDELQRIYKVSGYSQTENPTGIFFRKGESAHIELDGPDTAEVSLLVRDFRRNGQESSHPLKIGKNTISLDHDGLGYINYRSAAPLRAAPVSVKIEGGTINGIFSRADDDATWKALLQGACAGILDCVGERVQLAYDVEKLKEHNPGRGAEMLALHDEIVELQQRLMGWDQEGIHPGSHLLCRVIWDRFGFGKDSQGAGFHVDTLGSICNPDSLRKSSWGVAYAIGAVNRVSPGLGWAGLGQVANNLFASWCNYRLNPAGWLRLEHEVMENADGERMRGGRFDCYINNALVRRQLWQLYNNEGGNRDNLFCTLCPFWQLQLYFAVAREKKDFYPAIFRDIRSTDESGMSNGELRIAFFRRACDAAQLNLTDFFLRLGMLSPMNRRIEDSFVTITRKMAEDAANRAARYPAPDTNVLYYITGNSADIYKHRRNVAVSRDFAPVIRNGRIEVPANACQNAVAFEACAGKKLLRVSLLGLNHEDNRSTTVICPEGTTAVKAVQWDGKRYTICKQPADESRR
ncbi:MAG: M60 family metallopeptidase [Akkermansiaceae bacterium]|nr:M60 family metallopeptidase [Akkermansiaceae bacterium]